MDIAIMLEGQEGLTYEQLLAVARRTEQLRLAGVYRSDHYSSVAHRTDLGSTDAWTTLGGLARETQRLHIGTLVSPATFRPPAVVAKMAATVSEMAGPAPDGSSRVTLGMGTGWHDIEHTRHGFAFEDLDTRFRRLQEHLEVVTRLFDTSVQPFDYDGDFVTIRQGIFTPVPSPRPRIAVGGRGLRRTPELAARFADELNGVFLSPTTCREQRAALSRACQRNGRDPSAVGYSLMTGCLIGATDSEFRDRAQRLLERQRDSRPVDQVLDQWAGTWVMGTPEQARDRLGELREAGVECVMLQHLLHDDLDMIDLIAEELLAG
jgi:alkanesulfonate monooxygenase SsuD/methylene tetrahydromethanopterin reductase-like flavin-dependent oxidoreductase (luciferase family)